MAGVRVCFGSPLPAPVVERVLELRIERRECINAIGRRHIEFYKDDRRHGKWEWMYANGQKMYEDHYRDGERHGMWDGWYDNGQKMYEHRYRDDKRHGISEAWSENGEKWYEKHYLDGKLVMNNH